MSSRTSTATEFAPPKNWLQRYAVTGCDDVLYVPRFVDRDVRALTAAIDWREESLVMFGRTITVPRLCAWYGDQSVVYRYSNVSHVAAEWPPAVAELRDELSRRLGWRSNFVLANLYRDGRDSIGWHSDDERDLGSRPCIASLSFGASRRFRLRSRDGARCTALLLEHGSLLLMWGTSQRLWQHALPKVRGEVGARVNLTFRAVRSDA